MRGSIWRRGAVAVIVVGLTAFAPMQTWGAGFERRDVELKSQGVKCSGWYYVPKDLVPGQKRPAIVMAPGFSMVKEMGLARFAEQFVDAGFVVLLFDFRFLGSSGGEPRGQIVYYEQHQDYRNAISWVSMQKEVDPQRIGIWGSSFSGGHVLHLAAFDKRVKAVVAQVPYIALGRQAPEEVAKKLAFFAQKRAEEYAGGEVSYFPVVAPEGQPCMLPGKETFERFSEAAKKAPTWKNQVTVQSRELNREYAPATSIEAIAPTPLLVIGATRDILTPVELAKKAFERAGTPKKLVLVEGGHFDVYRDPGLTQAAAAAVDWFKQALMP